MTNQARRATEAVGNGTASLRIRMTYGTVSEAVQEYGSSDFTLTHLEPSLTSHGGSCWAHGVDQQKGFCDFDEKGPLARCG